MRWHPTTTRIAVILTLAFVVAAVVWLNRSPVPSQIEPAQIELAFVEGPLEDPGKLGLVSSLRLSSTGQIEVLVIYTQFADETDPHDRCRNVAQPSLADPHIRERFAREIDIRIDLFHHLYIWAA